MSSRQVPLAHVRRLEGNVLISLQQVNLELLDKVSPLRVPFQQHATATSGKTWDELLGPSAPESHPTVPTTTSNAQSRKLVRVVTPKPQPFQRLEDNWSVKPALGTVVRPSGSGTF